METMATRDDVTVRLDTELRAKARDLEINLSRLLEDTLREEIERQEARAAAAAAGESEEIRLQLEDKEGRPYIGRFDGKLVGGARGVSVYLLDDERVIVVDETKPDYQELPGETLVAELQDWFPHDRDVYVEVMHALGETPEIDL
jgi:post-segregation antitoxin (ccd killing protein)